MTMNTSRESAANAALLSDTLPSGSRPLSCGSLAALQLMGSPIYAMIMGSAPATEPSMYDLMLFAYVHRAPVPEVNQLAVSQDPDKIKSCVLSWANMQPLNMSLQVVQDLREEINRITLSMAEVLPEAGSDNSKNEPSPHC